MSRTRKRWTILDCELALSPLLDLLLKIFTKRELIDLCQVAVR
jgi:hypothetical protein